MGEQENNFKSQKKFTKTDEELRSILSQPELEEQLYRNVIDFHLQGTDNAAIVIKTIINDQGGPISPHWGSCLLNITQQEQLEKGLPLKDIRKPLRDRISPAYKYKYKVNSLGIRTIGQAQYSQEKKKNFSKKQSVSLINLNKNFTPPAFGYNGTLLPEKQTIVGLMFYSDNLNDDPHLLPSSFMSADGMTTRRMNIFFTEEEANDFASTEIFSSTNPSGIIFSSPKELFENCRKETYDPIYGYNESLIRIKWRRNDIRCQLGIFADTLSSRLLAQLRAVDMKINLVTDFIPISFYIYNKQEPKVFGYMLKEQQEDLNKALNDDSDPIVKAMSQVISIYNGTLDSGSLSPEEKIHILSLLKRDRLTSITKEQLLLKIFGINLTEFGVSIKVKSIFIEYLINSEIFLSNIKHKKTIQLTDLKQHVDIWLLYSFIDSVDSDLSHSLYGINNLLSKNDDYLLSAYKNVLEEDFLLFDNLLHLSEASINLQNNKGETALIMAVKRRNIEMVSSLLQVIGVDIHLKNNNGDTALILAIKYCDKEIFNNLLQFAEIAGIDINLQNNDGDTALIFAIRNNQTEMVNSLLQFEGIDINLQNNDGYTALMLAVKNRNIQIVNSLLVCRDINVDYEALLRLIVKPSYYDTIKSNANINILNILLPKISDEVLIKILDDIVLLNSCDRNILTILQQEKEQRNSDLPGLKFKKSRIS